MEQSFYSELGLLGLFIGSFIAATIIPMSSEALFLLFLSLNFDPIYCLVFATLGNWLGGLSSYYLGRVGNIDKLRTYFGISKEKAESFKTKAQKRGSILALLCWLPIIGDGFAVGLGMIKSNIYKTGLFMLLGKLARYIVLLFLF